MCKSVKYPGVGPAHIYSMKLCKPQFWCNDWCNNETTLNPCGYVWVHETECGMPSTTPFICSLHNSIPRSAPLPSQSFNQGVDGSSPSWLTTYKPRCVRKNRMFDWQQSSIRFFICVRIVCGLLASVLQDPIYRMSGNTLDRASTAICWMLGNRCEHTLSVIATKAYTATRMGIHNGFPLLFDLLCLIKALLQGWYMEHGECASMTC